MNDELLMLAELLTLPGAQIIELDCAPRLARLLRRKAGAQPAHG